jgi:hypothetical protein
VDPDPLRNQRARQAADRALEQIRAMASGQPSDEVIRILEYVGNDQKRARGIIIARRARDYDVTPAEVGRAMRSGRQRPRPSPPQPATFKGAYLQGKLGRVPDFCPECSRELDGPTCKYCGWS